MNNKTILYLILGGLSLIGGVVTLASIDSSEEYAKEDLQKDLSENDISYAISKQAKEKLDQDLTRLDGYIKEENGKIEGSIEAWKKAVGYDTRIHSIQTEAERKLSDFKTAIGYDSELQKIDEAFEEAKEKVKDRLDYDNKLSAQNKLIKDAERAYDTAVFFMEENQAAKSAKRAARKAKDKTIDTANEAIDELNKLLEKELKVHKKEAKEKKSSLEGRVIAKKTELDNEVERKTEKINKELSDARDDIISDFQSFRSDDFKTLLTNKEEMLKSKKDLEGILQSTYQTAYDKLSREEKLALYLKSRGINPVTVGIIGSLAGMPLFIAVYEYLCMLVRVVQKLI